MCGLSAIIVTNPEMIPLELTKAIFSLLMEENDDRGGHSWGAWGSDLVPVRGLGKYSHQPKPLHDHLKSFKYDERPGEPSFLFGHTRFGTHGARDLDNAHPFEEGNLILAHNGVVKVDGYTEKDHPVDSGQIAKALTQHGWQGMKFVEGACGLLVTVAGQPLVYRHEQTLHFATFQWGSVISSTLTDLELVTIKRLGLEPLHVGPVPEDTFCQPGFGEVAVSAPAKKRAPYVYTPPAGRGRWWEGGDDWNGFDDDRYNTYPYERASQPVLGFAGGGNFSGKSDLPKTEEKVTKRVVHQLQGVAKVEEVDDPQDACEYCGYQTPIDDLYTAITNWSAGIAVTMCADCIMDEILVNSQINVLGPYAFNVESIEDAVLVDSDTPGSEMDMLSEQDKAELNRHITEHFRGVHDV